MGPTGDFRLAASGSADLYNDPQHRPPGWWRVVIVVTVTGLIDLIGIGDRLTEARQRAREALAMAEVLSNG